jgi:hydrogenase expression/formation protein HypC
MCLAMPSRVVAIAPGVATVDMDGRLRRASLLLVPDVRVGDWVLVAAGTVLDVIDARRAAEIQTLLREALSPAPSSEGGNHVRPS